MNRTEKAMLAISVAATIVVMCWPLVGVPDMEKMRASYHSPREFVSTESASENSQLIAELQQGADILDKRVNEALERARYRTSTVKFVPVVVTAYNPVTSQTDSTPQITASNKRVKPGIVALSRDIEEEFGFKFGDTVVIEGYGSFAFEDRMNKRWTRRVDILMYSREAAGKFGVQSSHLMVSD
jgi:3D (Asp-Asp-Asp) domain-containing protein